MPRPLAYLGQGIIYAAIALVLGYFATSPSYQRFPDDKAQILLSFSHVGQRKEACRKPTQEELEATAANMRRTEICGRERVPVYVELRLADELIYGASLPPTGLSRDGASQAYERFEVPPGRHRLVARLRDSARDEGFDFEGEIEVDLRPGQNFVVDFRGELGGFIFGPRVPG
jgi:hypothetical protein